MPSDAERSFSGLTEGTTVSISLKLLGLVCGLAGLAAVDNWRLNDQGKQLEELRAGQSVEAKVHADSEVRWQKMADDLEHTKQTVDEIRSDVRELRAVGVRSARGHAP